MREQDKKVSYRPEIAEQLKKGMNDFLYLYETDQRVVLYKLLAIYFEKTGDGEKSELLDHGANLLKSDRPYADEEFYEKYESQISKLRLEGVEDLGNVTEATAFRNLIPLYKKYSDDLRQGIDTTDFSKTENYMLDSVFSKLESPLRNPNVQIKDGQTLCYYDRERRSSGFRDAMKSSIAYIRENIEQSLSIWEEKDEIKEELDR